MEKEEENPSACKAELVLQWGNRKRLNRDPLYSGRVRRKVPSRFLDFPEKQTQVPQPNSTRFARNSEPPENGRWSAEPPEKGEKYYPTRGSAVGLDEIGKESMEEGKKVVVWPKLYISLTSKEKEEDFMAMKGCKLPHRPKKRAKLIQRTLLLVSPGAWLSNMCEERYEVKEKKNLLKKRPSGLKAMGSMESDSE
jgi:hypothetical protein